MIGIFVRAVIFGLGVELGRELYKTAKTKAIKAAEAKKSRPAVADEKEKKADVPDVSVQTGEDETAGTSPKQDDETSGDATPATPKEKADEDEDDEDDDRE